MASTLPALHRASFVCSRRTKRNTRCGGTSPPADLVNRACTLHRRRSGDSPLGSEAGDGSEVSLQLRPSS